LQGRSCGITDSNLASIALILKEENMINQNKRPYKGYEIETTSAEAITDRNVFYNTVRILKGGVALVGWPVKSLIKGIKGAMELIDENEKATIYLTHND
jgi:tmRNA-binding protein